MPKTDNPPMNCYSSVIGAVGKAMHESRQDWIAGWLCGRFGVDVSALWVLAHWPEGMALALNSDWSDGSWAMWWKNRLTDAGLLPYGDNNAPAPGWAIPLHIGFVGLYESEDELRALRHEMEPIRTGYPDTPAIARTVQKPQPIDATSARVTNWRNE